MALTKLSDTMSLQMKTAAKEEQLTEKNNGFLQNIYMAEGVTQNLLGEFTERDHILDRPDDEDGIVSENPQSNFLHEVETTKKIYFLEISHLYRGMLQLQAENEKDPHREQAEQGMEQAQHEDRQVSTSLRFSEQNVSELSQETTFFQLNHWNTQMGLHVKELGADHIGWMEKINNIIQKVNLTENTVKSLLNEVMSLEGQIEKLELHQDLDSGQRANIENFCKDITLMNTKLGMYQMQEGKTDPLSLEEMEPLLPQAPAPPLGQNSPPRITTW
ncbi:hypothetical protein MC885_014881 [Smutsia gigantea]|nr:hypothetical protein MC885_014881 [Smutsia gigantea]